jgi:hypothetical protein
LHEQSGFSSLGVDGGVAFRLLHSKQVLEETLLSEHVLCICGMTNNGLSSLKEKQAPLGDVGKFGKTSNKSATVLLVHSKGNAIGVGSTIVERHVLGR